MDIKNKFYLCLEYARYYEKMAGKLFINYLNTLEPNKGFKIERCQNDENYKEMKHDIDIIDSSNNIIKVEVKTDGKSRYTDNYFIEFENNNKLSGIAITEADYYIINDTLDYYLIEVKELINLIDVLSNDNKLKKRTAKETLNNKTRYTKGFIIPKNEIIKNSIKLS